MGISDTHFIGKPLIFRRYSIVVPTPIRMGVSETILKCSHGGVILLRFSALAKNSNVSSKERFTIV